MTDAKAAERARIAMYRRLAHMNADQRRAMTTAARDAANKRFETAVDPDGSLSALERAKRADYLKSAHMRELALRSAAARRAR